MKMLIHALLLITLSCFPVLRAADGHDEADHDHDEHVTAGPNGGHVVRGAAGVAIEVAVDGQRRARITRLDEHGKAMAAGGMEISGIAGERSAPVKLQFAKDGEVLVSDKPLPDGVHIPMILMVKTAADAKAETLRFELHLH